MLVNFPLVIWEMVHSSAKPLIVFGATLNASTVCLSELSTPNPRRIKSCETQPRHSFSSYGLKPKPTLNVERNKDLLRSRDSPRSKDLHRYSKDSLLCSKGLLRKDPDPELLRHRVLEPDSFHRDQERDLFLRYLGS